MRGEEWGDSLGVRGYDRTSSIRCLAYLDVKRNVPKKLHPHFLPHRLRPVVPEYMRTLATFGTYVHAHVLDYPQYRHIHLLEHICSPHLQQRVSVREGDGEDCMRWCLPHPIERYLEGC